MVLWKFSLNLLFCPFKNIFKKIQMWIDSCLIIGSRTGSSVRHLTDPKQPTETAWANELSTNETNTQSDHTRTTNKTKASFRFSKKWDLYSTDSSGQWGRKVSVGGARRSRDGEWDVKMKKNDKNHTIKKNWKIQDFPRARREKSANLK